MDYYKLDRKISEVKKVAETGLRDVMSTGIVSLDGFLGLKKGFPLFIAGAPGHSKTGFLLEVLMNTSILYKWKHFIYCGEGGSVEEVYLELLHKYIGKPYKYADEKDKVSAEYFISEHFVVCNHDKDFTFNEFYNAVESCEKENNIKFDTTSFDPFNDFNDDITDQTYLSKVLKQVRVSSKKNNRIDILVNHAAKVNAVWDAEKIHRYKPVALSDEWAGGQIWERRGFTMVLVYKPPIFLKDDNGMPVEENEIHIHIQKAKPNKVSKIGMCKIYWDWQKNRNYSYKDGQKLYSCETKETIKQDFNNAIKPNNDFTETIF
jgi:hypothetical protein